MFLLFTSSGFGYGALLDEAESGALDRVLSSRITMTRLLAGKLLFTTRCLPSFSSWPCSCGDGRPSNSTFSVTSPVSTVMGLAHRICCRGFWVAAGERLPHAKRQATRAQAALHAAYSRLACLR